MSAMNMEQFEEFAKTLPEDANRRLVAKHLGLTLPLHMQLDDIKLNKEDDSNTITIPALTLEDGTKIGRRTIDARVARQVAQRMLAVCDANNL